MIANRVLVVGDVMLDEFCYGDVHRISPEAASPVLAVRRIERMIGGAGNVARGIHALGCEVDLFGVVGEDEAGRQLLREMPGTDGFYTWIMIRRERKTTHKRRFVSDQHSAHLLRVDTEDTTELDGALEQSVLDGAAASLQGCSALVLSDYGKGVVTSKIARSLISIARSHDKPIIVDSKRAVLAMYQGATIVKLNLCELGFCFDEPDQEAVAAAAHELRMAYDFAHVVVTRGENGLSCFSDCPPLHIHGKPVRVRDVSGAGDTIVATLAALLAGGVSLPDALEAANRAASIVVSKPGTAVVSLAELRSGTRVAPGEDWSLVDQRVREWQGKKIGFVNGCFDLLHTGHLRLLTTARANCDRLIVGINSDEAVAALKGVDRPVRSHAQRAEVLAALTDLVDLVVIFGDDPTPLVERVRPDIMFVGDDYTLGQVKGQQFSRAVHIVPRIEDVSTTDTIDRLIIRDSGETLLRETIEHARVYGTQIDRIMNGEPWCDQCHGPCRRLPAHGEFNI